MQKLDHLSLDFACAGNVSRRLPVSTVRVFGVAELFTTAARRYGMRGPKGFSRVLAQVARGILERPFEWGGEE